MHRHLILALLILLWSSRITAQSSPPSGTMLDDKSSSQIMGAKEYFLQTVAIIRNSAWPDQAKTELEQELQEIVKKGVPARELQIITARHLGNSGAPELLMDWYTLLAAASHKDLPLQTIADKIKEGLAKNIAPTRLRQTVDLVVSRLEDGKALMDELVRSGQIRPDYPLDTIELLAEPLWLGIAQTDLADIGRQIQTSPKKMAGDNALATVRLAALSLSKMRAVPPNGVPLNNSVALVKTVLAQPGYPNYYLADLVEIIRIAALQKKKNLSEIMTMVQNSVRRDVKPAQLADIMELGAEGLALVQNEITQTDQSIGQARKQLDAAAARAAQGMADARAEMQRAQEELRDNIERMKELKDLMDRMREEIEHLKHQQSQGAY